MAELTEREKREAIQAAYEKLSDDDKINIDVQVKRILDRWEATNDNRRGAKFQMSRFGALEILAALGMLMGGRSLR